MKDQLTLLTATEAIRQIKLSHSREAVARAEILKAEQARELIEYQIKFGLIETPSIDKIERDESDREFLSQQFRPIDEVMDFWEVPAIEDVRAKVSKKIRLKLSKEPDQLHGEKFDKATDHPCLSENPGKGTFYWMVETQSAVEFRTNSKFLKMINAG